MACRVDVRLGDVGAEVAAAVGAEGLGLKVVVQHAVMPHIGRLLQIVVAGEPLQMHHRRRRGAVRDGPVLCGCVLRPVQRGRGDCERRAERGGRSTSSTVRASSGAPPQRSVCVPRSLLSVATSPRSPRSKTSTTRRPACGAKGCGRRVNWAWRLRCRRGCPASAGSNCSPATGSRHAACTSRHAASPPNRVTSTATRRAPLRRPGEKPPAPAGGGGRPYGCGARKPTGRGRGLARRGRCGARSAVSVCTPVSAPSWCPLRVRCPGARGRCGCPDRGLGRRAVGRRGPVRAGACRPSWRRS